MSRDPELSRGQRWLLLAAVGVPSLLWTIQLCDAIYDCGCVALWSGAADACNVHAAHPPHCPWCATGLWGSVVPPLATLGTQALIVFRVRSPRIAAVCAALAFPAVGIAVGLLFGWATGYWS